MMPIDIITLILYVEILSPSCQEPGLRSLLACCAGGKTRAGCTGLLVGRLSPHHFLPGKLIPLDDFIRASQADKAWNNILALRAGISMNMHERLRVSYAGV